MTTPLSLSAAIRLGAMLGPQVFDVGHDKEGGSCALGAAEDSLGYRVMGDYPECWPEPMRSTLIRMDKERCPECGKQPFLSLITHLNDTHRWTREQIADLVEEFEMDEPHSKSCTCSECTSGDFDPVRDVPVPGR